MHPLVVNNALPRAMLAAVGAARGGTARGAGAGRSNPRDMLFTYATTARVSTEASMSRHSGMALAAKPFATTCIKSASVGGWPAAVDLYLNWPRVKSRGRGISEGAAGPLPRPSGPWHTAQRCA